MDQSESRQVPNGDKPASPGRELSSLQRLQRRLLYGGGGLLSLLILFAAISSQVSDFDDFHAQQREVFQVGQGAVDAFLTQRDRANANAINAIDTLWATQQNALQQLGTPALHDFLAQDQQLVVTAPGQVAVPWLTLGHAANGMPPEKLAAYLGMIHQYSTYTAAAVAAVQSAGKLSTYAYVPSGSLVAVAGFRDEAALFQALKVSTREQAIALLMRTESRVKKPSTSLLNALIGAGGGRLVSYYAEDPFNGQPSLSTIMTLMASGDVYFRLVVFEPVEHIKAKLAAETEGAFAIFTRDGQLVLETGGLPQLSPEQSSTLLHNRALWQNSSSVPVLLREHGIYMVCSSLQGIDWTLVHFYGWRDVLAVEGPGMAKAAAMALLMIAALWALLLRMDRRVFAPALAGASRVYESEALNRTIIQTSPVGLCLLDPSSCKLILQNDVLGQVIGIHDSAEMEALFRELLDHAKGMETPGSREFPWVRTQPDGEQRHLQVAMADAYYRNQPVQVCALRDITAQAALEENLRRARQDSEQARVAAESASRAKTDFVATMSHEIRTPLNGVLGHLELLSRSHLDPSQRERLDRIRLSADALLGIISDVLDFSRIEAGQLDVDRQPFQLRPIIEQAALLFAPAAQRKGVRLYYAIDPTLAAGYVSDVHRIRQMLNNLLGNAVKFTESGRIILRVAPGDATASAATWLRFQVIDSGIGMNEQQLSQLFAPFTQADASIARRYGGSGLGLALCRQLCHLLGGDIRAESTAGVGSVFTLDIPAEPVAAPAGQGLPLQGRHLSLLSAVPEWRMEISSLLGSWGATLNVASQPEELQVEGDTLLIVGVPRGWSEEQEQQLAAQFKWIVRAHADGPLTPEWRGNDVLVSCYDSQALLRALTMERDAPALSAHAVPVAQAKRVGRGKLLLVEDNPVNRELIQQQLEELGFEVDAAEDGEAALDVWQPGVHAAVLTDINMPRMNGYELAHALRANDLHTPILAITATALASEKARCRQAGISDVLLKPLTLESLDDALARHLRSKPAETATAQASAPSARAFPEKVLRLFVERGYSDLRAISEAMDSSNIQALIDAIHSFKGALLMLGESVAAKACSNMESRLRETGLAEAKDDLPSLRTILQEVVQRYEAGLTG